jgi:hypothetical protein
VVGVEESAIGSSTMIDLETDGRAEGLAHIAEMTSFRKTRCKTKPAID